MEGTCEQSQLKRKSLGTEPVAAEQAYFESESLSLYNSYLHRRKSILPYDIKEDERSEFHPKFFNLMTAPSTFINEWAKRVSW